MHIVHLASEFAPFAKVGGLADVVFGLAKACARLGHTVEVILPKYASLNLVTELASETFFAFDGEERVAFRLETATYEGVKLLFIDPEKPLFRREKIYGYPDDIDRFIFFCAAALELLSKTRPNIEVLHLHDWPAALLALLYRQKEGKAKILLTIHNLEHQGKCHLSNVNRSGLRGSDYLKELQDPHEPNLLNLLKGGIVAADRVTTVSPTYAQEILTPLGGHGLDGVLASYSYKLRGILNGIDTDFWNPKSDPYLLANYGPEEVLQGKMTNKLGLWKRFQMEESAGPLVVAISRLAHQKSPELLLYALQETVAKGGQFVLVGSAATPEWEERFLQVKKKYARHKSVGIFLGYDEGIAHLAYAAGDMIVIPSLFEPCGLTQMIALQYGCVPLVRETGGLKDTITHGKNGFTFLYPDQAGIDWVLQTAFTAFQDKKGFHDLILRGMGEDFSWGASAKLYLELYGVQPIAAINSASKPRG